MTAQGDPRAIFNRAIDRGNYLAALAAMHDMGKVTLDEAVGLLGLMVYHDPPRYQRAAVRWLERYLDERRVADLGEVALLVGALAALGGQGHAIALNVLHGVATS